MKMPYLQAKCPLSCVKWDFLAPANSKLCQRYTVYFQYPGYGAIRYPAFQKYPYDGEEERINPDATSHNYRSYGRCGSN